MKIPMQQFWDTVGLFEKARAGSSRPVGIWRGLMAYRKYLLEANVLIPKVPGPELLESMALRLDHFHGIRMPRLADSPSAMRMETDEEWKNRRASNIRTAQQLYEEATGQGFFRYPQ